MEDTRTKIICTIGPASSSVPMLVRMINAGMRVARLNFSHGDHASHAKLIKTVRAAARKTNQTIAILQDLQGPKIRVGVLPEKGVILHKAEKIVLTTSSVTYKTGGAIPVTYASLHRDVKIGHRILFDDGTIEVIVEKVRGHSITAKVKVPGTLTSHKGMNLPDSLVGEASFTAKDKDDLLFGVAEGVDLVALSFVSCADDIITARSVAKSAARAAGVPVPLFLAKVERRSAIDNFPEILAAADGILLGRGDLGVEVRPEEVPEIQKDIIEACRKAGKPVIVATQMLNSMVTNPRGTRAEVSDVANAVFDHTDAVMLSAESATGRYPAVTVAAMTAVIREAEKSRFDDIHHVSLRVSSVAEALAQSVHVMAASGLISGIAVVAGQGVVTSQINMFRPGVPIFMVCASESSARQAIISSGIMPLIMADSPGTLISRLQTKIHQSKLVNRCSQIAVVISNGAEIKLSLVRV
jgi:pyruvate kinase